MLFLMLVPIGTVPPHAEQTITMQMATSAMTVPRNTAARAQGVNAGDCYGSMTPKMGMQMRKTNTPGIIHIFRTPAAEEQRPR